MRQSRNNILTTRARRSQRRRGLSIIEVLVSIGILVLGLLGVIALIPIAAQHLRRGMALDDATATARHGLAEIQARGGNNIQKWLRYPPNASGPPTEPDNNGVMNALSGIQTTKPLYADLSVNPFYAAPTWAFCIDPLMYESLIVPDATAGANRDTAFFPYHANGGALNIPTIRAGQLRSEFGRMLRVTLNWNPTDWRNVNALTTQNLNVGLANSMCRSADDLLLSTPGDGQLSATVSQDESPASQFDVSMNSWDDPLFVPVKRNADGKMSWFATMVPLPGSTMSGTRYFTLSIAVCEQRDLVIDQTRAAATSSGDQQQQDVESERICGVRFLGGGQSGGEVQFVSYTTGLDGMKSLSRLREGNWILISGPGPNDPTTNIGNPNDPSDRTGHTFNWYRIGSIEQDPSVSGTEIVRNATLRGPDWPQGVSYSNFGATFDGEAIIPSNVINVFEHTIELRGE